MKRDIIPDKKINMIKSIGLHAGNHTAQKRHFSRLWEKNFARLQKRNLFRSGIDPVNSKLLREVTCKNLRKGT